MNLVDIAIVILVVLAAAHGVTQGAAVQVLSFGGFWGGLVIGAVLGPAFAVAFGSPFGKVFGSLLILFGLAVLGGTIGRILGGHAWAGLRRLKLGPVDAVLGSVVAIVATLIAVWLFAILLSGTTQQISAAIHQSAIVRALEERLPPAPSVFTRIQTLIDTSGFPRVFSGLEPTPAEPVGIPGDPVVRAAVQNAGTSTVRIVGLGCGGVQTGSGWVAGDGLVVTNAHVVAGISRPSVEDGNGRHPATPVLFDPDLDVAVLRTDGLAGAPLPFLRDAVERGTGGAILGFPGGGEFRSGPAAVLRRFQAVGRDIYGRSLTRRDVYQLQADVQQGNSGGPFTRDSGEVLGVIFAASSTEGEVGYALTSTQVAPSIDEASGRRGAVDTGACVS